MIGTPPSRNSAAGTPFVVDIDDETAGKMFAELDSASPLTQEVYERQLLNWASLRAGQNRQRREIEHERVFTDLNGWWNDAGGPTVPDEVKQGAAVRKFVADNVGRTAADMGAYYPSYRDQYFVESFGKKPADDKEAFALLQESVGKKKEARQALDQLDGEIALALLNSARTGESVSALSLISAWKTKNEAVTSALPKGWEAQALLQAEKTITEGVGTLRKHAPIMQRLYDRFAAVTGTPAEGAQPPEADVMALVDDLAQLPPADRQRLYYSVSAAGRTASPDKSVLQQFGESLARIPNMFLRGPGAAGEVDIQNQVRLLGSPGKIYRHSTTGGIVTESQRVGNQTEFVEIADDERKALIEEAQKEAARLDIRRELRAVADGMFDPIEKRNTGILGFGEAVIYGGPQALATSAAMMIPYAGPALLLSATYGAEYDELRLQGLPDTQARNLAAVSAPVQLIPDMISSKMLFGKFKPFEELLGKLANPARIGAIGRASTRFGASLAVENLTEGFQDLTTPLVQDVAEALGADYPDVDWNATLTKWADSRLDVFAATLLPVVVGTGAATWGERSTFAQRQDIYKMAGLSDGEIKEVEDAPDLKAKQERFKEKFDNRTPEQIAQGKAYIEEKKAAAIDEMLGDGVRPTLDESRDAQGKPVWTVRDGQGQTIFKTADKDSAQIMLGIARREAVQKEAADTTRGITEAAAYLTAVREARQTGEDVQRIEAVAGKVNAFDEYQANPNNLAALRAAVAASTGDDITEPEQLRGYWVDAVNSGTLRDGVYRSVIKLFDGADGTKLVRDFAQDNLKRAVAEGRVSMEWVREQLNQTIPLVQGSRADVALKTDTDNDVIESFSDIALAYLYGRVKHDQIAPGLRGFLVRMARVVRDIFRRAYNLEKARVAGQLDPEWQALLAQSVGIDQQGVVDAARAAASDGRGPDGLTDDERAALQAELNAEMEAEMADTLRAAGGTDILDAIKQAGGLPSATSKAVGQYAGELKILRENAKGGRHTGVTGTSLSRLFKKDAPDMDNLIRDLRGMGFLEIETPSDVFEMVERRIATGKPIYGYEGRATAGVLVGNYSVSKADDARHAELEAKAKAGDASARVEAEQMVDAAAKAAGYVFQAYHQTSAEAAAAIYREGFRLDKGRARLTDEQVPDAFFFKANASDIGVGAATGAVQIPVFLKFENAKVFEDRTDLEQWAQGLPGYSEAKADLKQWERENSAEFDARWKAMRQLDVRGEERAAAKADLEFDALLDAWKQGNEQRAAVGRAIITRALQESGHDAIMLKKDAGAFGRMVSTTAVFDPAQIKSADPFTYDEAGNLIPLSQRFDPATADINFSISSQSQLERVNAALSGLNRGPEGRAKIYERARDKFGRMLENNWGFLYGLKAGGAKDADVRRTKLLQAMGELDAILSVLPPEVRGKVGGYTTLTNIGTGDKALADFFIKRINMIDRELERVLRREWGEAVTKLFNRAKPQRNQPGQKPKGKFGYEVHDLFRTLEDATEWTEERALGHVAGLWAEINGGELSPEAEAHKQLEAELVPLFANWANADAGRMANAVNIGNDVLTRAYRVERDRIMRLRNQREMGRFDLVQAAGADGDLPARQAQQMRDNSLPGTWRAWMLNLFNFDQVVSYVFGENTRGVPELVNRQRAADNAKTDGIIEKTTRWADFISKLAGGNLAGQKLVFDMSQKTVELRWPDTEDGKTYKFSQNELLAVTMTWMQPRGREHMQGRLDDSGEPIGAWHYNQDFVNAAEAKLTDEARAVRDYLLAEYDAEYQAINDVYRRVFGINLPKEKNYSPLVVNTLVSGGQAGIDPVTGAAFTAGARSPGALKSRGGNIAEPVFRDVVQTYMAHMMQMEHWKAYAEFNADMAMILNHRDVRNVIEAKAGGEANKTLGTWLQYFNEGGFRDAANHTAIVRFVSDMIDRGATMALFGRVSTLALQSTQLAAASAKMPLGAYLSRLGKLLSGRLSWRAALESPYIQRRIQQMPPQVQLAMQGLNAGEPGKIKEAARRLGQLLSGFDGLFTAGTYAMVYDYQRSQGATEEQARAEAERIVDEIAQPTRPGARSLIEISATNPGWRAFWAFASEARKNLGLLLFSASKRPTRAALKAGVYIIMLNGLMSAIIRAAFRDLRDDEDDELFDAKNWSPKELPVRMLADVLYGFPVVGEMAGQVLYSAAGIYAPSGTVLDATQRAVPAIRRAPDTLADLLEGEADWGDVARDVNAVLAAMGLFNDQIAGAAAISNIVKDLFQTADAQLGPDE